MAGGGFDGSLCWQCLMCGSLSSMACNIWLILLRVSLLLLLLLLLLSLLLLLLSLLLLVLMLLWSSTSMSCE